MKRLAFLWVTLGLSFSGTALAQQSTATLSDAQQKGQQLFVQHCGICHLKIQINVPAPFGPVLSKASFENGREAQLKAFIADGTPNMPGFKYLFDATEIDAVVDYLKSVNPPAPRAVPVNR